jgi:hypothetical protein
MISAAFNTQHQALSSWEDDTYEKIKNLFSRGHLENIETVLASNKTRSKGSPLLLYDAWIYWRKKQYAEALDLLSDTLAEGDYSNVKMLIFAAYLYMKTGQPGPADTLLMMAEQSDVFEPDEQLALRTARIRLTMSLEDEMELEELIRQSGEPVRHFTDFVTTQDVMLPSLQQKLALTEKELVDSRIAVPHNARDLEKFRAIIMLKSIFGGVNFLKEQPLDQLTFEERHMPIVNNVFYRIFKGQLPAKSEEFIKSMCLKSAFRWYLATENLLLSQLIDLAYKIHIDTLEISNAVTLSVFRGAGIRVSPSEPTKLWGTYDSIDKLVHERIGSKRGFRTPSVSAESEALAKFVFDHETMYSPEMSLSNNFKGSAALDIDLKNYFNLPINDIRIGSLLLYILAPHPLELLAKRALGIPEKINI